MIKCYPMLQPSGGLAGYPAPETALSNDSVEEILTIAAEG